MIFRAACSIAFVAVFIPHEPDLGFGRPGAAGFLSPKVSEWVDASIPAVAQMCGKSQQTCAGGLALADDLRSTLLSNLDRVKAELKQNQLARSGGRRNIGSDLVARIKDF